MIINVQVSLYTTEPEQQVIAYNEDRTLSWKGPATREIMKIMGGDAKAFFPACLSPDFKFVIGQRAEWQDW